MKKRNNVSDWKIPVTWEMSGFIEVPEDKCPTLREAMKYATSDEVDLPDGEYVDSSFRLAHEIDEIDVVREVYNNNRADAARENSRKKRPESNPKPNTNHYEIGYLDYQGRKHEFTVDAESFGFATDALYRKKWRDDPEIIKVVENGIVVIEE